MSGGAGITGRRSWGHERIEFGRGEERRGEGRGGEGYSSQASATSSVTSATRISFSTPRVFTASSNIEMQ